MHVARRILPASVALVVAFGAVVSTAGAAPVATGAELAAAPGPGNGKGGGSAAKAAARVTKCVSSAVIDDRLIEVTGEMGAGAGGQALEMRFALYVRVGTRGKRFRHVKATGLDQWIAASAPDATSFRYRQTVTALNAPAHYRMIVRFRWLDSSGTTTRRASRTTGVCRQRAGLPDLVVQNIGIAPSADGLSAIYYVFALNSGKSEARNVSITVASGGYSAVQVLPALLASESKIVEFTGSPCDKFVTAEIDSTRVVKEAKEGNNSYRKPCG